MVGMVVVVTVGDDDGEGIQYNTIQYNTIPSKPNNGKFSSISNLTSSGSLTGGFSSSAITRFRDCIVPKVLLIKRSNSGGTVRVTIRPSVHSIEVSTTSAAES
eukprot:Pgem_evm1s15290